MMITTTTRQQLWQWWSLWWPWWSLWWCGYIDYVCAFDLRWQWGWRRRAQIWREWIGIALVTSHEDNLLLPVGWVAYLCLQYMFTHHSYTAWFYLFFELWAKNLWQCSCDKNICAVANRHWCSALPWRKMNKKAQQLQLNPLGCWILKALCRTFPRIFVESVVHPLSHKGRFPSWSQLIGETFYLKWWIHMSYRGHKFELWCSWSFNHTSS